MLIISEGSNIFLNLNKIRSFLMKNIPLSYLLFLTLIVFIISKGKAQPIYTIPWAEQQPHWIFPIWFEDASGDKDTIYFALDLQSGTIIGIDSLFGLRRVTIDTNEFHVYMQFGTFDTCKVRIGKFAVGDQVKVTKAAFPIIVKWNKSLLLSEPYPNYIFDSYSRLESSYLFFNYPQTTLPFNSVHLREIDSLFLPSEVIGGIETNFPLSVFLSPQNNTGIINNELFKKSYFINYLQKNRIMVTSEELFIYKAFNLSGQLVVCDLNPTFNKTIYMDNFPEGINLLILQTSNATYYEKIISY